MTVDTRREPRPGPLPEELRRLLGACGLPVDDTADRERAHGIVITPEGEGNDVFVEWFVSRTVREAAALEQRDGSPTGQVTAFHATTRSILHDTISTLLSNVGYDVRQTETGALYVRGEKRPQAPVRLGAHLERVHAELTRPSEPDKPAPGPTPPSGDAPGPGKPPRG